MYTVHAAFGNFSNMERHNFGSEATNRSFMLPAYKRCFLNFLSTSECTGVRWESARGG